MEILSSRVPEFQSSRVEDKSGRSSVFDYGTLELISSGTLELRTPP
jgi:hypothetical protein